MKRALILSLLIVIGLFARSHEAEAGETRDIVVAGGCFWCVESDFESVRGVKEVISGYTGGRGQNPTYKQVSRGGTGHYEAVRIIYDSGVVTRDQLYDMFFRSVDPTDAGGQFCDRGDSYRTAIFADGDAERQAAEAAKARAQAALGRQIVTPVLTAGTFWPAEDYHQDYYKGTSRVITRFGVIRQNDAYKRYREGCGRDQRVRQLWGSAAAFAH
ncbi:peptide-methionine (S)-S-oxide reductase MsrA [Mesobacterium sp. TK19101]|uniref:Peptide methionine sulfoxide reductase MsrA n=1 Tax=Mesobacterium hydrothermale TaxID=3111907 RepID=A0ABU6HE50_9RHOB|nr:peptide-methionine (S)-S-oxide reductase MsrA [Mesobacterium sp. TK19101]MEC3860656.1 peptide-methionine (S)-S-oxide reductase MsrA [Mesobacterium sp. TK19101]